MLAMMFVLTACASPVTSTPTPMGTRMAALLIGTLTVDDGCLRAEGTNLVIVFVPELTVTIEDDTIQVFNEVTNQSITVHIGDKVRLGGGEVYTIREFDMAMQARVPPGCPAPYWMANWVKPVETRMPE